MPRKKTTLKPKVIKTELITYSHGASLRSSFLFDFFQLHQEPKRPPIVNIIRKTLIERALTDEQYKEFEKKYNFSKKRIHDTLSSKFEPVIIHALCEYLQIPETVTTKDYIANYDFEAKEISKKSGARSELSKQTFLNEFEKSWSDETYKRYRYELANSDTLDYMDGEPNKQNSPYKIALFHKLNRIYDEYPELLDAFCASFTETNDIIDENN